MKKVLITGCGHQDWWYKNLVGQQVTVKDNELKDDYITTDGYQRDSNRVTGHVFIAKSDCRIVV
jgi:hypothetical protein